MLGQMIIARFDGATPTSSFLDRIRSGELGGVILFSDNGTASEARLGNLVSRLQSVAKQGKNPPLLIMTDQEGGEVKRLPWAPPARAAIAMTSRSVARSEGEATGVALRAAGINVDLAPVADVERVAGSFLGTRSFGHTAATVAERACAFAEGIASAGVAFTLKHFPGLGRALGNTDAGPTSVDASASAIREDYAAYRACGADQSALVMVSSAGYPSLTGTSEPAVISPEIYREELPFATGIEPLTISDDLQAGALVGVASPAQRAINAGLDLLLYAQTEGGSAIAFTRLLSVARSGGISRSRLQAADRAIETLKQSVAGAGRRSGAVQATAEGASTYPGEPGTPETIEPASGHN